MECLFFRGRVRAIGVSNFTKEHLQQLVEDSRTSIVPAINQVEAHPLYQQKELRRYCASIGIHVTAYSSLGRWSEHLVSASEVTTAAANTKCSSSQLLLKWAHTEGMSVIPRSSSGVHQKENYDAVVGSPLSGRLNDSTMRSLNQMALARGERKFAWDPAKIV